MIGIGLVIIGVTLAPLGYRWLGASWMWAGAIAGAVGFLLVLNAAREGEFLKEWRRGPGDGGDRNYLGGTTSASFDSADSGGGDGGGDG
jgi:hypothetical protein